MSTASPTKVRRKIHVSDIRAALEEIVAANPEHADPRVEDDLPPRYVAQGKPTCLVAMVLMKLGFSIGVLKALDAEPRIGDVINPGGARIAESRHPALRRIDPIALRLLCHIQDQQDRGCRWKQIVTSAFQRHRHFGAYWDRRQKPWLFQ